MEEAAAELPTVATIIGCPEQLSDTNGLVATPIGVPGVLGNDGADDAIQKALLENMCAGFMSKKDKDVVYCDVCRVTCTGELAYQAHVAGSKHAKKVKDREVGIEVDNEPFIYENEREKTFECTLCNVKLNAKNQIAAHVTGIGGVVEPTTVAPPKQLGLKHKSRLEPNEQIYAAAPRRLPYRQDMSANLLYCPTCEVQANSTLQMEQHMVSAKHINKVNGTSGPTDLPLPNRRAYAILAPGGPGGVPPNRYMPYPYKERDPYYDYPEYDRREYYRGDERGYDYDYPRTGRGSDYYSRDRYDRFLDERDRYVDDRDRYMDERDFEERYLEERERRYREYCSRREGMSDYRGSGRSEYGARPALPSSRYGSMNYSY